MVRPIQEQKGFEHAKMIHITQMHRCSQRTQNVHSYTPPSQMSKSVWANLSGGLQSLTGYRQVGAVGGTVGEVASAVVTVVVTASDTVGVGVSSQVLIMLNQIQHSVRCQRLFHFLVQCGVKMPWSIVFQMVYVALPKPTVSHIH